MINERLKDIGKRIQRTRKEKGISQVALAEQINISTPYLSDIENGKVSYSVTILMDITEALQVSADWLLRSDTPTTNSIQIQEASNILSDCTPAEAESLLYLLTETKKAIRKNKTSLNFYSKHKKGYPINDWIALNIFLFYFINWICFSFLCSLFFLAFYLVLV